MASVLLGTKSVGSVVKLREGGVLVDFYVAKHDYESSLNGAGKTLLVRKNCYTQQSWNNKFVNAYATSYIDDWLNSTYINMLDANIRSLIGTTKFYYTPGSGNTTKTTLSRSVFILSATELGHSANYFNVEGAALPIASMLKIAYLDNGSATAQWTRSPDITSSTVQVICLYSDGDVGSGHCASTSGYRPAFTLPSRLYVSDDGSVTTNTAPTTPPSISVPSSISGGTSIMVKWGVSSDAQGNLAGYKVEKSINGGSSWSQIYQGSALQTNDAVAFGTKSVMYRVKAYDTEGLESGYKTSNQVTVINNTAPSAPPSITVPLTVVGGGKLTVTWTASNDGEGNLTGYELERQVASGGWSQIFKGNALSFQDTITKGWASVRYRVRAYDTYNATSSYTTSEVRTVDNNTAPTIICDQGSGTDLGEKSSGFSISYTVNDVDNDTVTVTESMDAATKRTFQPTLGQPNQFQVTGTYFQQLLNGKHTMKMKAQDAGGKSAEHILTFTKSVTSCSITMEQPMEADAKITIMVMSVAGDIPADAEYQVLVTNNAKDAEPVWEDATSAIKSGANYLFTNETATNGFAFNFKLIASRGSSGIGGYISSIQGGFQ